MPLRFVLFFVFFIGVPGILVVVGCLLYKRLEKENKKPFHRTVLEIFSWGGGVGGAHGELFWFGFGFDLLLVSGVAWFSFVFFFFLPVFLQRQDRKRKKRRSYKEKKRINKARIGRMAGVICFNCCFIPKTRSRVHTRTHTYTQNTGRQEGGFLSWEKTKTSIHVARGGGSKKNENRF